MKGLAMKRHRNFDVFVVIVGSGAIDTLAVHWFEPVTGDEEELTFEEFSGRIAQMNDERPGGKRRRVRRGSTRRRLWTRSTKTDSKARVSLSSFQRVHGQLE